MIFQQFMAIITETQSSSVYPFCFSNSYYEYVVFMRNIFLEKANQSTQIKHNGEISKGYKILAYTFLMEMHLGLFLSIVEVLMLLHEQPIQVRCLPIIDLGYETPYVLKINLAKDYTVQNGRAFKDAQMQFQHSYDFLYFLFLVSEDKRRPGFNQRFILQTDDLCIVVEQLRFIIFEIYRIVKGGCFPRFLYQKYSLKYALRLSSFYCVMVVLTFLPDPLFTIRFFLTIYSENSYCLTVQSQDYQDSKQQKGYYEGGYILHSNENQSQNTGFFLVVLLEPISDQRSQEASIISFQQSNYYFMGGFVRCFKVSLDKQDQCAGCLCQHAERWFWPSISVFDANKETFFLEFS